MWEYPSDDMAKPFKHIELNRLQSKPHNYVKKGSVNSEERFEQSLSRSRRLIKDYLLCNSFQMFVTCTFAPEKINSFDYTLVRKSLTSFFNDFRKRVSPSFRYLLVPEKHKSGAWHFHGVVKGIPESEFFVPEKIRRKYPDGSYKLVPNTPRYVSWKRYEKRFGWFNCSYIKDPIACATYVSKYITKDLTSFFAGRQVLLNSKGLAKPELVFDGNGYIEGDPDFRNEFCSIKYENFVIHDQLIDEWFYKYSEEGSSLISEIELRKLALEDDGILISQLSLSDF